jgi:hypothetical protein
MNDNRNVLTGSIKNEDAKQMTIWQMKDGVERQHEARYTKENGETVDTDKRNSRRTEE